MTKHYIGQAGLHGCMPNYSDVFETYEDAVESLAQVHELGRNRKRELKRNGYIELNLRRDGNEYAEVTECECDEPEVHSDC